MLKIEATSGLTVELPIQPVDAGTQRDDTFRIGKENNCLAGGMSHEELCRNVIYSPIHGATRSNTTEQIH